MGVSLYYNCIIRHPPTIILAITKATIVWAWGEVGSFGNKLAIGAADARSSPKLARGSRISMPVRHQNFRV